ncbi:MAG: hypothetical protein IPG44_13445 [Anaerolineales bacterium]|jgi:hypothetical protein|nr:hypothetical protein [Anaerolineales bacterium]
MKKMVVSVLFSMIFSACGTATPLPPVTTDVGADFTLAPGQSAALNGTDIELTLIGVPGDERCPLLIECAMSGPVTIMIAVKSVSNFFGEFQLTTFTDTNGSVPPMEFEGVSPRFELNGYSIRVVSVLPFPRQSVDEIRDEDYRVTFEAAK